MNEEETLVRELRDAVVRAAEHGYYADYLAEVVAAALRDYPRNPDDERAAQTQERSRSESLRP